MLTGSFVYTAVAFGIYMKHHRIWRAIFWPMWAGALLGEAFERNPDL